MFTDYEESVAFKESGSPIVKIKQLKLKNINDPEENFIEGQILNENMDETVT